MKKDVEVIKIILAVIVAVIALLVRMPSAFLVAVSEEQEDAFTDESGLPYFTDPDSYYHIRLVDTMLKTGRIADTISPDGEPWDIHSFYPEGRSGVYQQGIVHLTIILWKIFNLSAPIDISRVEFYLSGFMAMLTALMAFITGCRINGKICGFVAGILVGCAPEFVSRTLFGRFDTDIFVVLMNILLILFITEMFRANTIKKQLAFAFAFIATSMIYANCWAPQFSMLFVGLTIVGGLIFAVIDSLQNSGDMCIKERIERFFKSSEFIIPVMTGALVLIILGITMGFSTVGDVFSSLRFSMTQEVSDGVLPNLFESISELGSPAFAPKVFKDWFRGYVLGSPQTVITGIGGVFVAVAATGGLVLLFIRSFVNSKAPKRESLQLQGSLLYFSILGVWTVAGLYLTRSGIRFIEILTVPAGLLAGIFTGWITQRFKFSSMRWRAFGVILSITVIVAVVLPDFEGLFLSIRLPSVTDASADAMKWIRKNANDPEAVIESWWDYGYFYESESGHPCIWDGGTQDAVRAILFSRAMVDKDMKMSCCILNMLASSGNKAVDLLMKHTDPRTAFETLWEVLPMNSQDTCAVISDKCGMSAQDAEKTERLIHPKEHKEAYLILTETMIRQTTMYEYYSNWDFTGTQISPYEPEDSEAGIPLTEDEMNELEKIRYSYTMWSLFFDVEDNPYFTLEYEYNDGIEGVRMWKIMDN